MSRIFCFLALLAISATHFSNRALAAEPASETSKSKLAGISSTVFSPEDREKYTKEYAQTFSDRIKAANRKSSQEWHAIKTTEDWEKFRDAKLAALKKSLGTPNDPAEKLEIHTSGTIAGEGYKIEKIAYNNRGLWITANLYLPSEPKEGMPGILLCHSHHTPKHQGELQDMGVLWAKAGCAVLVPDHIGHGERRQHPFVTKDDYSKEFQVGRQDYHFRYDTGMQLHLAGESLIGWMAFDLMRGVDVLLAQKGIDPKKIVLLGGVAGGGDPAAVAGAIDTRIAVVGPMNFGGPQPETKYPLPANAEETFNYSGSGGWESTRNLRLSASEGFLPWVIVGSIAPRKLVYSHEFAWDREHDPVWARFEKIWSLTDSIDGLDYAHGTGNLQGRPPEASHCGNYGEVHRVRLHEILKRWLDIHALETSDRHTTPELAVMTPELQAKLKPKKLHEVLTERTAKQLTALRAERAKLSPEKRREAVADAWRKVLGPIDPVAPAKEISRTKEEVKDTNLVVERVALQTEPGVVLPLLLIYRNKPELKEPRSVIVCLAQGGKDWLLKHKGMNVELFTGDAVVCLPDLRGTGELSPGGDRDQQSPDTGRSSTQLMLGETAIGARLRDLRSLVSWLRTQKQVNGNEIGLMGVNSGKPNGVDVDLKVPRRVGNRPDVSEPMAGILAMLGGLYDDKIHKVFVEGGLVGFQSVLASQLIYLPHDAVIPGALMAGDLEDIELIFTAQQFAAIGGVDGQNRLIDASRSALPRRK